MPVVENYWSGVLRRLQAEVDVFNELIMHAGERGRENELSFARMLAGLVPSRYGIGTGLLIDADDRYSKQTDIVIYDQADEPAILAQTSQVLFPVESVRACLEVKTSVGSEEILDAGKKRSSVHALVSRAPHKPIYALVGYRATSYGKTIANTLKSMEENARPDLTCVINLGFVGGYSAIISPNENSRADEYQSGLALLQERDSKGKRIAATRVSPEQGETSFVEKGISYPVTKAGREYLVVEPSRALLIFCETLVRALADQDGRPAPALSHYLTPAARDLHVLD